MKTEKTTAFSMLNNLNLHITYTVYRMFNILDARHLSLFTKTDFKTPEMLSKTSDRRTTMYYIRFECKVDIGFNLLIYNMLNCVLIY